MIVGVMAVSLVTVGVMAVGGDWCRDGGSWNNNRRLSASYSSIVYLTVGSVMAVAD